MLGLRLRRRLSRDATPLRLATEAAQKHEWELAARYYREALNQKPDNPPIWVQYGHALKESGSVQEAEVAYRKSLEMAPNVADTHLQLGHALKIQGNKDEAAVSYLRALALDPTLHYASLELLGLGWTMAGLNDWAIGHMERAMWRGNALSRGDAVEERKGDATHAIVFDVSDLMHFFLQNRVPTGIQRVQINVIVSLLQKEQHDLDLKVACFTADTDFWVQVPANLFVEMCELAVAGGQLDDPAWRSAMSELKLTLVTGRRLQFRRGAVLINIGTSWWLKNYFLMVRLAKSKYGIRYIPFVHDCIPILTPEHCVRELTQDFISWLIGVFFHADGYFVNSRATAADLVAVAKLLGHTISEPAVIRLDGEFATKIGRADDQRKNVQSVVKRHGLDHERFVLFVGTIKSRKNHLMAFNVWLSMIKERGLRETPMLVCVGNRGWLVDAAMARLDSSDLLKQKVKILSMVSDHDLAELYRRCLFTIFPSSYEGWGLPITESLYFGKIPLITAVSSLPEAGGDLAEYFDLQSERDMLSKLERLIDDEGYREEKEAKIRQSFRPRDWTEIADEIVERVLEQADMAGAAATICQPTISDEIWPIPAQSGRYYSMSRNTETRIWGGMVGGEMYRMGENWWAPDDWGTWLKGDAADIAFSLPERADEPHLVYLGVLGNPQRTVNYNVDVAGGKLQESGKLEANERRWLILRIDNPTKVVHLRLVTTGSCNLADVADSLDRRVVSLGVIGFYVCREDDLLARYRFTEAVQLNRLHCLNGRSEAHEGYRSACNPSGAG